MLVPGGHFLYSDIRIPLVGDADVHAKVAESGLEVMLREDITAEVRKGLDGLHESRLPLIKQYVPKVLVPVVMNFAGTKGTKTYNSLQSGEGHCFLYVLRKAQA